ncbi:MAG TPA: hypothetical protein P5298_15130, partial [Spirochaetia bacterium]|nr:hypothetical protein [Spirochaetia bacterium]
MRDLFTEANEAYPAVSLRVFNIAYQGTETMHWHELFSGFDTLKAITYSSSLRYMHEVIRLFKDVEIIFGNEMMIGRALHEIIAYQDVALKNIRSYIEEAGSDLLTRIDEGSLRLYVAKEQLSHEKLYLLSREDGMPRSIVGSANFSYAAFGGAHREHIEIEQSHAGYEAYLSAYTDLREHASNAVSRDQILFANAFEGIDKLPVMASSVRGTDLVILPEDNPELVRFSYEVNERAKRLRPLVPERATAMPLVLKQREIAHLKQTFLDDAQRHQQRRILRPQLIINVDAKSCTFNGELLDLTPPEDEVRHDVELFSKYMEGFNAFHGQTEEMKARYFELATWFFASPFMPIMRRLAIAHNRNVIPYPVFGLVYGQSKAGKTSFLETLLLMMIGVRVKLSAADFTKNKIETIKRESAGAPVIVDDMVQKRFSDYAIEAIKNDDFGLYEDLPSYPSVVISANEDVKAVDKQVTRRTVTCHVQAGLTTRESIRSNLVTIVQKKIGTAFYRRYLKLMFDRVPALIEQFASERQDSLPDILALSSEVLYDVIGKYVSVAEYPYIRKLSVDSYFDEKVAGAGVIERIHTDWRMR